MSTDAPQPSTSSASVEQPQPTTGYVPPPPPSVRFECRLCAMVVMCHYQGDRPPFARTVRLSDPTSYVMKDPFVPTPSADRPSAEHYLVLGADCSRCSAPVCRSSECSLFYKETVCLTCAQQHINAYPLEIRAKINRALSART